ncbi:Kinetochore-associated protein Dsn1/Mis13 [Fusarium oxysporum f. sp. vasinfectum]|nr:Kinetochore-associated protein Dsn1/Mis13 [Fusarium oxysporum f. sp. vasinfectum]
MSNEHGRRLSKRPAAAAATDYEHDDDFAFVRKSKRIKTDKTDKPKPEALSEPKAEPVKDSTKGRPAAKQRATKAPTTNGTIVEEEPSEKETNATTKPATRKTPKKRGFRAKRPRPPPDWDKSPQRKPPVQSATIALPMSDTPIINRNKEMRKKGCNSNRRSSLGNRGRRASSLIESGQTAIPHRAVNPADYYKHIEAEGLTEPRRMKQLLTWCGERALAGKPPHSTPNSNAILGARAIQANC